MSASSCAGSSVGGLVKSCGACTVAMAETISPILNAFLLLQFVDVFHAEFFELRAKTVKIDAQFSPPQPFASHVFLGKALLSERRHFSRELPRYHDNAIGVGDDDVSRTHAGAGTNNRHV